MPDRMPNRMSEDMSDRMPEDLPVRKCINVMVGITRSKVIYFHLFSTFSHACRATLCHVLLYFLRHSWCYVLTSFKATCSTILDSCVKKLGDCCRRKNGPTKSLQHYQCSNSLAVIFVVMKQREIVWSLQTRTKVAQLQTLDQPLLIWVF